MGKMVFALCALAAGACALLLWREYVATRFRLLAWSAACFTGLTANNVLLVLDRVVFTEVDLSSWRLALSLTSIVLLLCGLVLERTP